MKERFDDLVNKTGKYLSELKDAGMKEVDSFKAEIVTETHDDRDGSLKEFYLEVKDCKKCALWKTRNNLVFGGGDPNAELVFIGEAPGHEEDKTGKPFVGRAGKLLNKIIKAIDLSREQVYICNVLKCRPPHNRSPKPEEIRTCLPYLERQLSLLKNKKVICTLGLFAAQTITNLEMPMGKLRNKWFDYNGTPVMPTYHPAYLLRNPVQKRKVWEDMKKVRKCLHG